MHGDMLSRQESVSSIGGCVPSGNVGGRRFGERDRGVEKGKNRHMSGRLVGQDGGETK